MYRDMTAAQLREWEADYRISPWGEYRKDLRAGVVASACLAPHSGKKGPPSAEQFVMFGDRRDGGGGQSKEEMKAVIERIARRHREAQESRKQREQERGDNRR
ncbi:MAG: hypothetical protein HQ581_27605 [Planctomycetes bacterium]|nr:hypothetical protein [Planctomycetota bacterium]